LLRAEQRVGWGGNKRNIERVGGVRSNTAWKRPYREGSYDEADVGKEEDADGSSGEWRHYDTVKGAHRWDSAS